MMAFQVLTCVIEPSPHMAQVVHKVGLQVQELTVLIYGGLNEQTVTLFYLVNGRCRLNFRLCVLQLRSNSIKHDLSGLTCMEGWYATTKKTDQLFVGLSVCSFVFGGRRITDMPASFFLTFTWTT